VHHLAGAPLWRLVSSLMEVTSGFLQLLGLSLLLILSQVLPHFGINGSMTSLLMRIGFSISAGVGFVDLFEMAA
jgi:hypothetical protein